MSNNINERAYLQGFMDKCAQYGVAPDALLKEAGVSRWISNQLKRSRGRFDLERSDYLGLPGGRRDIIPELIMNKKNKGSELAKLLAADSRTLDMDDSNLLQRLLEPQTDNVDLISELSRISERSDRLPIGKKLPK